MKTRLRLTPGSLQARMLLLVGFVLLVVLASTSYRAYERRQIDLAHALHELQEQADGLAAQQAAAMAHAGNFLELLQQAVNLGQLARESRCDERLATFIRTDPRLANLLLVNLEGQVLCSSVPTSAPVQLADRAYFRQALHTGEVVMGDAIRGRYTGRYVFPYAQRYSDAQGRPQGVVVAGLELDWITQAFARMVGTSPARMGLVREDGTVLARYPDPQTWVGRNIRQYPAFQRMLAQGGTGTLDEVAHDGERRIYAFAPFVRKPSGAVYLWVNVPRDSVTAEANREFVWALGMAFVVALGAALGVVLGGQALLVRPLQAVMRAARELSAGNAQARTGLPHGEDEMGRLALAFDEMANRLTRFDLLTGLLNEKAFIQAVDAWIARAPAQGGALLRVALDNQQHVEGHFGLAQSQAYLRFVSGRLTAVLEQEVVVGARLEEGGFAVLLASCSDMGQVSACARRVEAQMQAQPFEVEGVPIHPEVRMGVCFYPDDGRRAVELLQRAGVALHHARADAGTRLQFFEPGMNERMQRRMQLVSLLRVAIEHGRLELHYQPQLDLRTQRVRGFEALVRWRHPALGYVSPAEFVPLAEESGLIQPLGAWVLREALQQRLRWRQQGLVEDNVRMAINLSPLQLLTGRFDELLAGLLAELDLPAGCVELELTESHLLGRLDEVARQLQRFNAMGVQVAVDDFGTGYSSLAYLKQYAVDKLKIDKSFIDGVIKDTEDQAIVRATIAMAHALGLTVIAEGVETALQMFWLRAEGCDQIQGYHYCKPLPVAELERFLWRRTA